MARPDDRILRSVLTQLRTPRIRGRLRRVEARPQLPVVPELANIQPGLEVSQRVIPRLSRIACMLRQSRRLLVVRIQSGESAAPAQFLRRILDAVRTSSSFLDLRGRAPYSRALNTVLENVFRKLFLEARASS